MEQDRDDWLDKRGLVVDRLLDSVVSKWIVIAEGFRGKPKSTEDSENLMNVLDLCQKLDCMITSWHEEIHPMNVPWLPVDKSALSNMVFLRGRTPWSFTLTYAGIQEELLKKVEHDTLTQYMNIPQKGTFLCCVYHDEFVRALSLEVMSFNRLKVFDIDTCETLIIPKSAIYHLPKEESTFHALSLQCTMLENDDSIKELWTEDMENVFTRALKGCILRVDVVKTIDECPPRHLVRLSSNLGGKEVNFSDWLHKILIPEMKQLSPLIAANELIYFLKDEALDPHMPITREDDDEKKLMKEKLYSILCHSSIWNQSQRCITGPQQLIKTGLPEIQAAQTDNTAIAKYKPTNVYYSNQFNGPSLYNHDVLRLLKLGSITECAKSDVDFGTATYSPYKLKNPLIPTISDRENVVITHVLDPSTFYVVFGPKYSEIVENGVFECPTTLLNRINNPGGLAQRPYFQSRPTVGQLVIFFDKKNSLWVRGVVIKCHHHNVEVFNPDVGSSESVLIANLRTPHQLDTVLPSQAVLALLHNLRAVEGMNEMAREYFSQLTRSKNLRVLVKNVDLDNSSIHVELFTSEDVSINSALLLSGFYTYKS